MTDQELVELYKKQKYDEWYNSPEQTYLRSQNNGLPLGNGFVDDAIRKRALQDMQGVDGGSALNTAFETAMLMTPMGLMAKGAGPVKNYLANQAFTSSISPFTKAGADYLVDPEEHPWGNLATNIALDIPAIGAAGGLRRATTMGMKEFGSLPNPLANETGSIASSLLGGGPQTPSLWEQHVGSRLSQLGDKVLGIPLLPADSRAARWMGGNTGREWLYAPKDRMPEEAGKLFTGVSAESERIGAAFRQSGMGVTNLNLDQRINFREVLRKGMDLNKATPENRELFEQILQPVTDGMVISKQKLANSAQKDALLKKDLSDRLLKLYQEDVSNPEFQIFRQATSHDLTTTKGTEKFLDEVLSNSFASPTAKAIARDLYDLPASTAQEVSKAHARSFEKVMLSEVLENPDWAIPYTDFMQRIVDAQADGVVDKVALKAVKDQMKMYVDVPGHEMFKGMKVHKDIAEGIRDMEYSTSAFRTGFNKYFLNPWKFMKIGLNPAARPRDFLSNIMFNDIAGQFPLSPFSPNGIMTYKHALDELRAGSRGSISADLQSYLYWTGAKQGGLNSIALDPIYDAMRHGANPIDSILGGMYNSKVGQISSQAMQATDLWAKFAKYKHNLANGMDNESAAIDAARAVGDHTSQSRAIRNIRDTLLPFAGWQSHSIKQVAHGFAQHPIRTAKWFALPYMAGQAALEKLDMTPEEFKEFKMTLPEYMSRSVFGMPTNIPLPYRDEKGRIQMMDIGWWLPGLQDLSELGANTSNPLKFVQNPALTLGATLAQNKKFTGAPVWNEWDEPSAKASKALGYIMSQLMPPLMPGIPGTEIKGGNQWANIVESFNEEDEEAKTKGQAFGAIAGYRVTPIDEAVQAKKFDNQMQNWSNEATSQLKRKLNKTEDEEEIDKLLDQYIRDSERINRYRSLEEKR